jgi:molecular chaperone DnaJ
VLSDPDKRAAYDARGKAAESYAPEDLFGGIDLGDLFGGVGGGGGIGPDWFERLFGWTRMEARRGPDLELTLEVPLERIAHGGEEDVHFTRPAMCPTCGGRGVKQIGDKRERCPMCGGRGRVDAEDTVRVRIPPGAEESMTLRFPNRGVPVLGGHPGDLVVVVRTRPDRRFQRRGADLIGAVTVGMADAALGIEVEVPALTGRVHVKVPAGTQPGTILRLRGQGLPRMGSRAKGDMLLTVHVRVPTRLTGEQRRALEQLRSV